MEQLCCCRSTDTTNSKFVEKKSYVLLDWLIQLNKTRECLQGKTCFSFEGAAIRLCFQTYQAFSQVIYCTSNENKLTVFPSRPKYTNVLGLADSLHLYTHQVSSQHHIKEERLGLLSRQRTEARY